LEETAKRELFEETGFDINEIPKEISPTLKKPFSDFVKYIKERDKI
jgi:8-oxo-dGTP pyrophosphatase MutT (NUDIX family)